MKHISFITSAALMVIAAACDGSVPEKEEGAGDSASAWLDSGDWEGVDAVEIHYFHDKAWKLTVYEGRVLATTQHGEEIWSWDPSSETVEEFARDLGDVQGVAHWRDRLWVTHSISGVEGSVSELTVPNSLSLVATQTASGELMRRPLEMAPLGDSLAIADMGGPRVWTLGSGATNVGVIETPLTPLTLATMEDTLFVGTDDGVFRREGETWLQVDERAAYGLASHGDRLWATNASDGLFVVGEGGSVPMNGPARPGSVVGLDEALFFVDEVGGSLWSLSPAL